MGRTYTDVHSIADNAGMVNTSEIERREPADQWRGVSVKCIRTVECAGCGPKSKDRLW